ncbi:MAG: preprotein translocase subunit SecE [Planctomycetes bacterium]|nr:preprotein translocase subunit SecE [Planctomycetota bacterium]
METGKPEAPAGGGPRPPGIGRPIRFQTLAVGAAWLAAFCAAATVYFLPPSDMFLTRPMGGNRFVTPMLFVGAAVFGGLGWLVMKKRGLLAYSKPGQGRWVRACAYLGFAALAMAAAVTLFAAPGLKSGWYGEVPLWSTAVFGKTFELRPIFFPSATVFLGAVIGFHIFVNRDKVSDFLVETQGELRKVSWPAKREWVGSTVVVVILITFVALFLHFADVGLSWIMQKLKIGF